MNLWKVLPNYPTQDDFIYELNVYLVKDGRPNGSFSEQTLTSAFGKGWEETKLKSIFETLVRNGSLIEDSTKSSSKQKSWYKIKDNPYYK